MSEEENIHGNLDLSNSEEEEVTSTEPVTEPVAVPELEPEREVEIISSVTEKTGVEEAATEEAMREQQIHPPDVELPQLRPQTKPKKQTTNNIMKIESSFTDASKQIEKQTSQINKINQNLLPLQK